ncbi:MAG TPA: surface-adhesin E family protein [Caulobacteraceae bacterium]|nr:surface-adhesin E family protein [Caulobacteraceae bacterium]
MELRKSGSLAVAVCMLATGAWASDYKPYPTFARSTDTASLDRWATENLIDGKHWEYIDDRWALFVTRLDKGDNPPFAVAIVRFEVTTQTMAGHISARSMVRTLQVNCSERTDRWIGTIAYKGNNMMGGETPTTADNGEWAPFADPRTAQGNVDEALCKLTG